MIDNDQKKGDSFRLIELMREWSGFEPKMWGPTIIGFGNYHYKYASDDTKAMHLSLVFLHEKVEFSLYVFLHRRSKRLLAELGKFKMTKCICIYVKKLS